MIINFIASIGGNMRTKVDRRVRKTRKQLRTCLATLLMKKKIQDITVTELTDLADLNRGTFYLHYKDVYDLLESLEEQMFIQFNTILDEYLTPSSLPDTVLFEKIFAFIEENQDLSRILLGPNGDINYLNRIKQTLRQRLLPPEDIQSQSSINYDALFAYSISGFLGLLDYWFDTGMKATIPEMAHLANQLISTGTRGTLNK